MQTLSHKFRILAVSLIFIFLLLGVSVSANLSTIPTEKEVLRFLYPELKYRSGDFILESGEGFQRRLLKLQSHKWSGGKGALVVLLISEVKSTPDPDNRGIQDRSIMILQKENGEIRKEAVRSDKDGYYLDPQNPEGHFTRLDPAVFRLNETTYAVGIRYGYTNEPARYNETLSLFIRKGRMLHQVFEGYIEFSDRFRWYRSEIIFSKKKFQGYFNMIRRTVSTPIIEDSKRKKEVDTEYFQWDTQMDGYRLVRD